MQEPTLAPRTSSASQGGSRNAELSHYLRLVVYSYLPLETLLYNIAILNKHERKALENSAIVRVNKEFKVKLTGENWLDGGQEKHKILQGMLTYIAQIVSGIKVRVIIDKNIYLKQETVYEKLTELIISLPHWFDKACFSLVNMKPMDNKVLDEFCRTLAEKR